jgi:hypothetical protein
MLSDETIQNLLTGGLDDHWKSICRSWIDESKRSYEVASDLEAIEIFSDKELLPNIALGSAIFKSPALGKSDFIGLPTPRFAVLATKQEDAYLVAIHEGFLRLMRFLNEVSLLSYVLWTRLSDTLGDMAVEFDAHLNAAKIKIGRQFLQEPFRLPSFFNEFSDQMKARMQDEMTSMLAFAVHHELAHHELGHSSGCKRVQPDLLIDESMNIFKAQEFEADEQAIGAVQKNLDSYIAGVCLFLRHLAELETFTTEPKATHPFAINRINHLAGRLPSYASEKARDVVTDSAKYMAKDFARHRDRDMHLMFDLFALAKPDRAIRDVTVVASVILDGNRMVTENYPDLPL